MHLTVQCVNSNFEIDKLFNLSKSKTNFFIVVHFFFLSSLNSSSASVWKRSQSLHFSIYDKIWQQTSAARPKVRAKGTLHVLPRELPSWLIVYRRLKKLRVFESTKPICTFFLFGLIYTVFRFLKDLISTIKLNTDFLWLLCICSDHIFVGILLYCLTRAFYFSGELSFLD